MLRTPVMRPQPAAAHRPRLAVDTEGLDPNRCAGAHTVTWPFKPADAGTCQPVRMDHESEISTWITAHQQHPTAFAGRGHCPSAFYGSCANSLPPELISRVSLGL